MKKIILSLLIIMVLLCGNTFAEELSLSEKLQSNLLINNDNEFINKLNELNDNEIEKVIEKNIQEYKMTYQTEKIEPMKKHINEMLHFVPQNSFCFYLPVTEKYSKQYADLSCFDSLISDDKIWIAAVNSIHLSSFFYEKDFSKCELSDRICDDEAVKFLMNTEAIEEMINEEIDEKIIDCKIVYYNSFGLLLYLKGENTDYGIILYDFRISSVGRLLYDGYLDRYKIYPMEEIMNSYGMISLSDKVGFYSRLYKDLLEEKPSYDTEMSSLMEAGIIAGTDKGAEPLKPLNRIEATAILVRILGLENAQTSKTSYFTDIASDNWGAKYANIAYDAGITKGVENGNFAPNDKISASQFATLLLRSRGETNIDWQTAVNLFVERGIITQEQADKMDLFTRGDMAKIIYECRERGIIN